MKYLFVVLFLTGCATTQDPTLESFMRNSYFIGCKNEAEALAMSKIEEESAYFRCDVKSKNWNIYNDVPQYNDNLDIIRRRQNNLDRR